MPLFAGLSRIKKRIPYLPYLPYLPYPPAPSADPRHAPKK